MLACSILPEDGQLGVALKVVPPYPETDKMIRGIFPFRSASGKTATLMQQ